MANSIQAAAPADPGDPGRRDPAEPGVPGGPRDAAGCGDAFRAGYGGLSWTWELDIDAVLAAVRGAAPWQRPPANPGFAGPAPDDADATTARAAAADHAPHARAAATATHAGGTAEDATSHAATTHAGGPAEDAATPQAGAGHDDGAADGASDDDAAPAAAAVGPAQTRAARRARQLAAFRARKAARAARAAQANSSKGKEEGPADPEADEAAYQEAVAAGRVRTIPLDLVAGRIAETLPTGPALAAWLGQANAVDLEDGALAGIAASFHRMAAWAAAGELAAVAQLAARSARTDRHAGTGPDGRPDTITSDAAGQVALALAMSRDGATSWADLGVVLTWRLPATGAALAAGQIDLPRARMIARMTTPLTEGQARQVEAAVLGRAGWLTLGQLHAALRRAVIKADPDGAERRRQKAERDATVAFYPDDEGTAALAGYNLPGVQAAAAMARITALARALKLAGHPSQISLLRVHVFLGLLLGTLPNPGNPDASTGGRPPGGAPPPEDAPSPADAPAGGDPAPGTGPSDPGSPEPAAPAPGGDPVPGTPGAPGTPSPGCPPPVPDVPQSRGGLSPAAGSQLSWPAVLPHLPWPVPADGTPAAPSGLLNLAVPLATLTGTSGTPGQLSWLGTTTAAQARHLAALAARHPATRWRIVVASPAGQAIAVTHIPRSRSRDGPPGIGLIRRVTLLIGTGQLAHGPPATAGQVSDPELASILNRALTRARLAARDAADRQASDRHAGGCAHQLATPAYRPPPRITELVTARDQTCRFGPCRRPAEHCDLDHTRPYHQGGRTCPCNLGGECRTHHQLKQHPRWTLTQTPDGEFCWTTPAGRSYLTRPDTYTI